MLVCRAHSRPKLNQDSTSFEAEGTPPGRQIRMMGKDSRDLGAVVFHSLKPECDKPPEGEPGWNHWLQSIQDHPDYANPQDGSAYEDLAEGLVIRRSLESPHHSIFRRRGHHSQGSPCTNSEVPPHVVDAVHAAFNL